MMASRKTVFLSGSDGISTFSGHPAICYSSADLKNQLKSDSLLKHPDEDPVLNGSLSDRDSVQPRKYSFEYRNRWEPKKAVSLDHKNFNDKDAKECNHFAGSLMSNKDEFGLPVSSPPPHKTNYFRPLGMRNNFLGGQQMPTCPKNQPIAPLFPHRDSGDLVAMGTNWQQGQSNVLRSGNKTASISSVLSSNQTAASQISATSFTHSAAPRKFGTRPTMNPILAPRPRAREPEPHYSDPLSNAPPTFNQRLSEVASLEADTVRWEKARKMKKKPKSDN